MAVAVTNSTILKMNTIAAVTSNLATADTDALAEVFTITPTVGIQKLLVEIGGTGSAADDVITYSFAAGEFWAAKAVTSTITKNTTKIIEVDLGMVLKYNGTILLTLTPAATDKLVTNHNAFVKVYELM
jgi:uncharacterized glyoxalase superfamily metalloenzyme YdcJ